MALFMVLLTWLGILGGTVKWLIGRQDAGDDACMTSVRRAHERLDTIPETFVRREEVLGHFERIETQLGEGRRETNERFDRLYEILLQQPKDGK